ncbi:phosphatase PAP2 family protein [Kineococcus rubinsiae]|uniref:phosphatase PAP2 family protein n=1 Tax=Kineococcus rubinsiae TaxID=2609562 RepID=UPI001431E467|nr:phosphatase PAP2 family protein [Kineococcus rubinsiae]NIZ93332.1 phosphatase PAP2 family protein [Kineococcus rubinsiae]
MVTSAPAQQSSWTRSARARVSGASLGGALVQAAAFAGVYLACVRTVRGQLRENALHETAVSTPDAAGIGWLREVFRVVERFEPQHLLVAVAAMVVLGALSGRGRLRRTVLGVGVAAATLGVTEVLKLELLTRPTLSGLYGAIPNSLPSGHTSGVLGLALGFLLVAPRWLRPLFTLAGAAAAGAMGAFVIDHGWHRVSDVLASALVGSVVLCLALALPSRAQARTGRLLALAAGVPVLCLGALVVTYVLPTGGLTAGTLSSGVVVAGTVLLAARALPREVRH